MEGVIETSNFLPCEFEIQDAMVHILNVDKDKPILTEYFLNLDESIYKILHKQVEKFFKNKDLRFSKFGEYTSKIPKYIREFNESQDIILFSKKIAELLFDVMKENNELSCDLFILKLYTNQGVLIGCLKIDHTINVEHVINENDKVGINLESNPNSLPSKMKFSKGAFFKLDSDDFFDLYVIDPLEKSKKGQEYDRNYFSNSFLRCEPVEDTRSMTNTFVKRTEAFITKTINNAEEQFKANEVFLKELEEKDEINIYEFAKKLIPDNKNRDIYCELVNDISKSGNIILDKIVCKKISDFTLELMQDTEKTKVTMTEDTYKDINKFEAIKNGDGTLNIILKGVTSLIKK